MKNALLSVYHKDGLPAGRQGIEEFAKELIDSGVRAILSTSGSVRDNETVELCQKEDVVLYMIPDGVGRGFFNH